MARQAWTTKKILLCLFFLFCGTWNSIGSKLFYQTTVPDRNGHDKAFKKPWFEVWAMFVGMAACSIIMAYEGIQKRQQAREARLNHSTHQTPSASKLKVALLIAAPTTCDMLATFFQSLGLLWTDVSIWQMLRGSIIIFTVILRLCYLREPTSRHQLFGVGVVVLALVVVGSAAMLKPQDSEDANDTTTLYKFIGIVCMLVAQFIQALQNVIEEKLLHDAEDVTSPAFVATLEGLWGILLCSAIMMPIAQYLPGKDGDGIHEDTIESFIMLGESPTLILIFVFYAGVIMIYNWTGLTITQITEATTRNVIDALRNVCVWIVALILFHIWPQYGETWGWWSWIELVGFLMLTFGFFVYEGMLKLPFLSYVQEGNTTDNLVVSLQPANANMQ